MPAPEAPPVAPMPPELAPILERLRRHRLHPITRQAIRAAVRAGLESLRAQPYLPLSDWAAEHFVLAGESSQQRGGWQAWPFQVGWLDAFSNDDIQHVDVQKSKRVGYTKSVVALCAYEVARRQRNVALWQPTDDDRDSFVKSEIDPAFDTIPAVRAAERQARGRDQDTIKLKRFRGAALHLLGGKAARAYRRITVATAILDEWSGFDQQVEKSADPATLARGRLEGAAYPKFVGGSTPRLKGLCHVERSRQNADVDLRYHIPCIHCGEDHPLTFGGVAAGHGLRWTPGLPETARHVCPHCGAEITQADYLTVWAQGAWVCHRTGARYGADRTWRDASGQAIRPPRHVAFLIWSAYSPQRDWPSIAREFAEAKRAADAGDTAPLQGFVNETLAETWELVGDRAEESELQQRAEPYPLRAVPAGGLILTAGVDVQSDRWEIGVWAWGRGMESWAIDHHVIHGNPADDRDWEPVTEYLLRRYRQAWHGGSMGLSATSIDSGHHTHAVYAWCRRMHGRLPMLVPVKGDSALGSQILMPATSQEVSWGGQKWPHGIKLYKVGVDTAKDLLHDQLRIDQPGPGYVHTSTELPAEWYRQLTAEQRIPVRTPTGEQHRWVKRRPRNEVLDCRNYATHAAHRLGLHRWPDARWQRLEDSVQPPADLFSGAGPGPAPESPTPAQPVPPSTAARPVPAAPIPAPRRLPAPTFARTW